MYKGPDGQQYSLQDLQAAADSMGLTLSEYVAQYNFKFDDVNHVTKENFDNKEEDELIEELNKQYGDKFSFDVPFQPGVDAIRATRPDGQKRSFRVNSKYNRDIGVNKEMKGTDKDLDLAYNSFIGFLNEDTSTDNQKSLFRKTGLSPENYPELEDTITTEKEKFDFNSKFSSSGSFYTETSTQNVKVDEEQLENLYETSKKHLSDIYDNPAQYNISPSHSGDTQKINLFEGDDREKINDKLYEIVKEETGLNISKDEYVAFLNASKGAASNGMFQRIYQERAQAEKYNNFLKAQTTQKDLDVFGTGYYKNWTDTMLGVKRDKEGNVIQGQGDLNMQTKYYEVKKIRSAIDKIEDLKARSSVENRSFAQEISDLELQIEKSKDIIGNIGKRKIKVKLDDGTIEERFVGDGDEEMQSNFYTDQGYSKESAKRMADSYKYNSNNTSSILQQMRLGNGVELTDREAMKLYYDGLFKRYFDLQLEASDKKIKIDLFGRHMNIDFYKENAYKTYINDDGTLKDFARQAGMTLDDVEKMKQGYRGIKSNIKESELYQKLSTVPGFNTKTGVGELSYADLHKAGFTSRRFDGFFDFLKTSATKEDREWMQTHDQALDDNEGARRAMFKLYELDVDPEAIEKPGLLGAGFNTAIKAFDTHFFGASERSADERLAALSGKTNTNRYMLDQIEELQFDYNTQNKKAIEAGTVRSLEFTEDQKDHLSRTLGEEIGEGVGHFMPMLVELAAITAVTKGTGAPAYLANLVRTGTRFQKMMGHLGLLALEEGKMRVAGFKPTSGAAFYVGGAATQNVGNFTQIFPSLTKRFPWMNPLWAKTIKAGPVGAASMEFASLTELAYEDFMDVKDFKAEFDDLYGDFSETSRRVFVNSIVFGMVGAQNIKGVRFVDGKVRRGTDLMTTAEKSAEGAAIKELQAAQDKILGEEFIQTKDSEGNVTGGRRKNYKDLKGSEKEKYDAYQKQIDQIHAMYMIEMQSVLLDTKNPDFEKNFDKIHTKPKNKFIQEAVGKDSNGEYIYKGFEVEFIDGNSVYGPLNKNQASVMSPAQYIKGGGKNGKDLIKFDKTKYNKEGYKGKEIHEIIGHAAFEAVLSSRKGLDVKFQKRMADVFRQYDTQLGKMLGKGIPNAPESLKEIIEILEQGRSSKIKDKEYLAYMLEIFSNPNAYYEIVAPSAIKEIKQEFTSFFEEFIPGYKPKIKNAEDFVGYLGRLTQDMRRDLPYKEKLTRFVNDNPLNNLKVKDGRYKLGEVDLLSTEMATSQQRRAQKDYKSKDIKKELIIKKNTELSEKLKLSRQEGKEQLSNLIEGQLIRNNNDLIETFVNDKFDPTKGGERADFKQETLLEVIKLTRTFTPEKGEYGAYLIEGLYGGGGFGGGRSGAIFDRFVGTKQVETVSIDSDGSFLQLEGGVQAGGTVGPRQAEAGLTNLQNKLKLTNEHVKSIENKVDLDKLENLNYRDLKDLSPNITMEMFGGRADVVRGESSKNIKQKSQYIADNWKTLYDLLPHGAMLKTGKSNIEGLSTMIEPSLLNGRLYNPVSRKGSKAQASAAETGRTAGLPVQNKIKGLTKEKFLEKLGIFLEADGKTVDFKKTKIKAQSKELRAVDGLITETGRAITNQVVRNYLEKIGNEGVNPELRDAQARDALYNQIKGGKSETLYSRDIFEALGTNIKEVEKLQAISMHQYRPSVFKKRYGQEAYDLILDIMNHEISNKAVEGVASSTNFVESIKNTEFKDLYLNHPYASKNLNDKSTISSTERLKLLRDYVKNNESILEYVPSFVDLNGNTTLLMDLLGMHRKVVGKDFSSRKGKLGFGKIKQIVNEKASKELPKEILDLWNSINFETLKGSYNSSIYTAWRNASAVGGAKGREQLAKFLKENPGISELQKFYDVWNRTLEHWAHTPSKKLLNKLQKTVDNKTKQDILKEIVTEREYKLGHVFKLKKANSQMGTTGERNLAPGGYYHIPETGFFNTKAIKAEVKQLMKDGGYVNSKGNFTKFKKLATGETSRNQVETYVFNKYSKFEHLKSSSEQSLMSAMMIANRTWNSEGYKSSEKYRGIYGRLADFNMIDFIMKDGKKISAKTSTADIFRFGQNLELAKNIYSVKSGLKKTLYQEIMESQYAHRAKNLENFVKNEKLDKLLELGRDKNKKPKGISVFDFDDTLAKTNSKVIVTMPNGKKFKINATEFAKRDAELTEQGAKYDFSEFNKVIGGKKGPLFDLAMKRQDKFTSKDIFVLTARPAESALAIHKFLKGIGLEIPLENIKGLADGRPEAKVEFIKDKYIEGYNDFYFADDAIKNVKGVKNFLNQLDVKSDVQQALNSRDLSADFNKILENSTGIGAEKIYSKAKGQVRGANKGRFKFFIPPSAEDFVGLIYPTLGKGKLGDQQMAWYKKNLLDPYARAENAITREGAQMMRDFQALKQQIKSVPKGIRKKIKDGPAQGFTKEQAIRVYIWNKSGLEIPGLSKTDIKELSAFVKNNKDMKDFADGLVLINGKDGYTKPDGSWLAGTITTDLIDGIKGAKRTRHLKEWKQNRDEIFSPQNLNKYEAAYGANARASLENILGRMETGSNRKKLGGYFQKLENEVLDWTNNSVGAIMFLNSRSAVLQTISAINYVNFRDNNPLAMAKAVANQPQFWADFKRLMNSDYLVQRRDGLKININESEIVAASEKGGVKGAISYLLNKGFLFTRYADSFAIASGGSSFYRNRINTYKKKGMSLKEAEKLAFRDFRELTEESQQSSRPDRISSQQASGLGRVVLAFANTPMQYARLQKRAIQDLVNGRGDAKTNLSKIAYYGFIQNVIFNALQQAFLALGYDADPDDQKQIMTKSGRVVNGMLDSQLRGLGYGGAAISTVKNMLYKLSEEHEKGNPKYEKAAWEMLDFAPPISSKVTKVRSALRSLDYDLDEMKTKGLHLDNPAYLAGGNLVSAFANVPVDRAIRKMENIRDAFDEDQEMWARVALLAGWSEWDLGISEDQKQRVQKEIEKRRKERQKLNNEYEYNEINYEDLEYETINYD